MEPLAMIVAVARNGVIGAGNALPWRFPEDSRFFRERTTGHAVISGRKTYESIGKPLPNRRNIVVSRSPGLAIAGAEVAPSLEAAIALARTSDTCPFVIGGGELYAAALPATTLLYVTEIDRDFEGDARFPAIPPELEVVERRRGETPELTFVTYVRRDG